MQGHALFLSCQSAGKIVDRLMVEARIGRLAAGWRAAHDNTPCHQLARCEWNAAKHQCDGRTLFHWRSYRILTGRQDRRKLVCLVVAGGHLEPGTRIASCQTRLESRRAAPSSHTGRDAPRTRGEAPNYPIGGAALSRSSGARLQVEFISGGRETITNLVHAKSRHVGIGSVRGDCRLRGGDESI